ncbi:MAG: type II secretion system protein GspM [Rhodoferax sp.]
MSRAIFNRIAWLQALTVVTLLLPLVCALVYVWIHHQRIQGHLADLEPRYARMAGLIERESDLKTKVSQAKDQLARLAYPAGQDVTQAGNDAQQRIRSLFSESKLDIVSIQVLPPKKEDAKFDRIPIDLRVEGDLAGIQNALLKLSVQTPAVVINSLTLQTIGAVKPASIQRLGGQFNFYVLRVRS